MATHLENLEAVIGPSSKLVVTVANKLNLFMWAQMKHDIHGMPFPPGAGDDAKQLSAPELANLYHEHGPGAKLIEGAFADLVRSVERTGYAPLDVDRVKRIVKDAVMTNNELVLEQIGIEIDKLREVMTPEPVRIEMVAPNGVITPLNGLHHVKTPEVIRIASLGDPIMMIGPAGCGKTTIAEMTAKALDLPFRITSTVFDTHELMGFVDGHGYYHRTPFRDSFELGGVWVADEIDAWDAAALLAANSALANGYATFPDNQNPVNRHDDFRMLATANTFGKGADRVYIGRNQLDAASLDRFAFIVIDYDRNLEMRLTTNTKWAEHVWKVRDLVEAKNIRHVVSTRAITKGSKALAIDVAWSDVENYYLFKGMSDADRKKINDWIDA